MAMRTVASLLSLKIEKRTKETKGNCCCRGGAINLLLSEQFVNTYFIIPFKTLFMGIFFVVNKLGLLDLST